MASRKGGNTFLTAGLPFVTFIIGGSYMLSQACKEHRRLSYSLRSLLSLRKGICFKIWSYGKFVSGQVHVKDLRKRSRSLREFDIEEEHASIMKDFKKDFEIKRVPRPDEK